MQHQIQSFFSHANPLSQAAELAKLNQKKAPSSMYFKREDSDPQGDNIIGIVS
ncbi:MAG: hypothetical protein P1U58_12170 [Verrucomicrobiales bacterium]|nr:hypothetical protein [Verrucomicrobiales bacterium]